MGVYEKHTDKMRRRIVERYVELCCEKGIVNVQLVELCRACEIYRSTFYHYFDNLDDLLQYTENEIMEQSIQIQNRCAQYPAQEYGEHFYGALLELFYDYRAYLLALLSASGSPRFAFRYRRFLRENLEKQLGIAGKHLALQVDLTMEYIVNGMVGSLTYLLRCSVQQNLVLHKNQEIVRYFVKTQQVPQLLLERLSAPYPNESAGRGKTESE